jgi:dihydrofolate reductase
MNDIYPNETRRKRPAEVVAIVAMGENRVIGVDGALPWRLPADLKRFKAVTTGHPVIMGRLTFESIGRRPLPGRRNIVVSAAPQEGVLTFPSLSAALEAVSDEPRAFIIGGGRLYASAFAEDLVDRVDLTRVALAPSGDTAFPAFEAGFRLLEATSGKEGDISFRFETWTRLAPVPLTSLGSASP